MWDTGKKRPTNVYETLEAHEGHSLIIRSATGKMEIYCTQCGSVVFSAAKSCVGGLRITDPDTPVETVTRYPLSPVAMPVTAPVSVPAPVPAPTRVSAPAPMREGKREPLKSFKEWKAKYKSIMRKGEDAFTEEGWAELYKKYVRLQVKKGKPEKPKKSRVEKAWDASADGDWRA